MEPETPVPKPPVRTQRVLSREALRCILRDRSGCLVEPALVADIEARVLAEVERCVKGAIAGREEECRRRGRKVCPGGYLRARHLARVLGEARA